MTESKLPLGVQVIPEGIGDARHVLLDIEGSTFELHPDDARAIGEALVRIAAEVAAAEEPAT
jgi:hypothetical protein